MVPASLLALRCEGGRRHGGCLPRRTGPGAQAVLRLSDVTASQALGAPRDARSAADTTTDRYRPVVDVYVLLRRPDGMILLLERSGTGYADGQLCPPSGHLEEGESVARCAVREAAEETGVGIEIGRAHV